MGVEEQQISSSQVACCPALDASSQRRQHELGKTSKGQKSFANETMPMFWICVSL